MAEESKVVAGEKNNYAAEEITPAVLLDAIQCLAKELRGLESSIITTSGERSPEQYRKFKHKDTGRKLCTTEWNPGSKWERICIGTTWTSQGACDRDSCS